MDEQKKTKKPESESEANPAKKRKQTKVKSAWSHRDIMILINSVKKEPCLWNANDENYTNRDMRREAWQTIHSALKNKFEDAEIRAKWTNLRITLRLNQKKEIVCWKYFEDLLFIDAETDEGAESSSDSNSSAEESGDENVLSAARCLDGLGGSTSPSAQPSVPDPKSPAAPIPSSLMNSTPNSYHVNNPDPDQLPAARDEALAAFMLSELRSLSERDANLLRCRLQRTLLEFNEERQLNVSMNPLSHIELKYDLT